MERTVMQNGSAPFLTPRGLLVVDKPAGITSTTCVGAVKRLLPRGTKVGHAGTLDAFATGVLIIMVGKATRACESLMGLPKEYEATIKLGATTVTIDPDSPEQDFESPNARPVSSLTAADVAAALKAFEGTILQRPPEYSALKLGGKRFSDRVREGEAVRPEPRPVRIDAIELLEFAPPSVRIRVACGRGTYVRSIARDLGESLGVGGYLLQLRRTRVGPHTFAAAVTLDSLDANTLIDRLVSVPESLDRPA